MTPTTMALIGTPQVLTTLLLPLELTWAWPDTPILIAITIVVAVVARMLLSRLIKRVVNTAISHARRREDGHPTRGDRLLSATGVINERQRQRTETLGSLLRSITTFIIAAVAILTILSAIGLPLGPLLASAGVGGVALGIGAQSLVKDFLAGIFMIIEDQYGVGDWVDTGTVQGTVEEVSLRVTRIRDGSGVVWYVRNGEIVQLGNLSQGWSTATIDIPVSYNENPQRVIEVLRDAAKEAKTDPEVASHLIDDPQVVGVESIVGGTMTIRIVAKCRPNEHWPVQREMREYCKQAIAKAGIKGPELFRPSSDPTVEI